jgi:adenylylsulfate kinase
MKILIMGLPGAGKTTLAVALAKELGAVHFNADDIRKHINKDLGFSPEDRVEQARRMGHLCEVVGKWGAMVIADFVCPTPECREAFDADFTIWVDRISEGRYADTNKMFVPPNEYNIRITQTHDNVFPTYHAEEIARALGRYHVTKQRAR